MISKQIGDGLRTTLRPSSQSLLNKIKDEPITSLKLWREVLPYSKIVKFLNPNTPYDKLFHLSLNINNKYNLEKDGISVKLFSGGPKGEIMDIPVQKTMTIGELIDRTKNKMGESDFYHYDVVSLNCQNFVKNLLQVLGSYTSQAKEFVEQDVEKVLDGIGGKFAKLASDVFTAVKEVASIVQEGGGKQDEINYKLIFPYQNCDIKI